jgi:glycosyltransferase involved in cell wall biosynthesis
MKILQIAPAWIDTPPKNYGGTEWVIYNLAEGLHFLKQNVTLFATKESITPVHLKYVFEKSLSDQKLPWSSSLPPLLHYHQAIKIAPDYDLVHAHLSSPTDLMLLPLLADLTEKGIPNVITIHSPLPLDTLSKMDSMYINQYAKYISVINISYSMQKKLAPQFNNAGVVHNTIHTDLYKYNGSKGKYLTWLGKILPKKGLLEAILISKKAGEQLIFAGVVDNFQPESVDYFENIIKPLIDNKQIKYIGPADLDTKNKLLGNAKAFLYPLSWEEPFGMVLVEAMACGTPVISYNLGATSEIIQNNVNGFLIESPNDAINAIKNISKIKRINCRKHVEQNFSPIAAAKKHLEIYKRELNRVQTKNEYSHSRNANVSQSKLNF